MSSKRRLRRKACEGKRRYATIQQALAQAARLKRMDGDKMNAYYCHFCGGCHVGHPAGTTQKVLRNLAGRHH